MHLEVFADPASLRELGATAEEIRRHALRIACLWKGPEDLVAAVYIVPGGRGFAGKAFIAPQGVSKEIFRKDLGKEWACVRAHGAPEGLPEDRFNLLLVRFGSAQGRYPAVRSDRYGWSYVLPDFHTHLVLVLAHELAHLALLPVKDYSEDRANAWAVRFLRSAGYRIGARRPRRGAHAPVPTLDDARLRHSLLLETDGGSTGRAPASPIAESRQTSDAVDNTLLNRADGRQRPRSRRAKFPPQEVVKDLESEFELLGLVGRGVESAVFKGRSRCAPGNALAIKVLKRPLRLWEQPVEEVLAGLTLASRILHPHLLRPMGRRIVAGHLAVLSPWIDGPTLTLRLSCLSKRKRLLPLPEVTSILLPLASALDALHVLGVHLDVKPGNVFLKRSGFPLLGDFGAARAHGKAGNGRLRGTPGYAAPETASGKPGADGRADVYSLGAVLHEMLAGEIPRPGSPSASTMRPGMPLEMDRVISRALHPDPEERFATAGDLARAYLSVLAQASIPERPEKTASPRGSFRQTGTSPVSLQRYQ